MKASKIQKNLKKKGFTEERGDHLYFHYYDEKGNKTIAWTKLSHSANEIGEPLISQMAKQTQLSKPEFERLINCTLSKEDYNSILKKKGIV